MRDVLLVTFAFRFLYGSSHMKEAAGTGENFLFYCFVTGTQCAVGHKTKASKLGFPLFPSPLFIHMNVCFVAVVSGQRIDCNNKNIKMYFLTRLYSSSSSTVVSLFILFYCIID